MASSSIFSVYLNHLKLAQIQQSPDNYNGAVIKLILKGWLSFIVWLVNILDTVYLRTPYLWRVGLPVVLFLPQT
jgi:hypothetical protein